MPEQIISASGAQNPWLINAQGRGLVDISGASIHIGSVSANVDSIYIQSGNNIVGSMFVPAGSMIITQQVAWTGVGSTVISGGIVGSTAVTRLPIGSNFHLETTPIGTNKNNPAWKFEYVFSGTSTGATGSQVGSITQFIGAGSFVSVLTYNGGFVTNIGSYV